LLAEYDGYGVCLREYIYIGAKMVAEYQPQTGKYYYYTTDQIGSTRIVTDDVGNMVYAAAHDPYGGVQQTWVNVFNPKLKFSGKEQDAESALYYFGARYYDPALYRFLSPDPIIPTDRALYNPQRWNLYGYCGNNPLNYVDISGANEVSIHLYILRTHQDVRFTYGVMTALISYLDDTTTYQVNLGSTREPNPPKIPEGDYIGKFGWTQSGSLMIILYKKNESGELEKVWLAPGKFAAIHKGETEGCIVTEKDVMGALGYFIYYAENLMPQFSKAIMGADQINMVLLSFQENDLYSMYAWVLWFISDKELSISVRNGYAN